MYLHLKIDGDWNAQQFGDFFQNVQEISSWFGSVRILDEDGTPVVDEDGSALLDEGPEPTLIVRKIQFGSPGFTDLLGVGSILEQIRLFFQFLIERSDKRNDPVALEDRMIELQRKKIALAKEAAELQRHNPKMVELLQTSGPDHIILAIEQGRLIAAELRDDDR